MCDSTATKPTFKVDERDLDFNRTECFPHQFCGECHYNSCPKLWGGNPERPACIHNYPQGYDADGQPLPNLGRVTADQMAGSGRIANDADVAFSVTRSAEPTPPHVVFVNGKPMNGVQ